jgi:hypothetical protein
MPGIEDRTAVKANSSVVSSSRHLSARCELHVRLCPQNIEPCGGGEGNDFMFQGGWKVTR